MSDENLVDPKVHPNDLPLTEVTEQQLADTSWMRRNRHRLSLKDIASGKVKVKFSYPTWGDRQREKYGKDYFQR